MNVFVFFEDNSLLNQLIKMRLLLKNQQIEYIKLRYSFFSSIEVRIKPTINNIKAIKPETIAISNFNSPLTNGCKMQI